MGKLKFTSLVDGGYLSFILGSRRVGTLWNQVKGEFKDALVCMDDHSYRRDIFPDYKSRRAVNRWADKYKKETYEYVREFRKHMELDGTTPMAKTRGAESDDLVAAFYLADRSLHVMGIDKDLQGVPGLYYNLGDYYGQPPRAFWERVPKYIRSSIPTANCSHIVLYQTLCGDKSDSIPRLLPSKGAAKIWKELYDPSSLRISFENFSDFYGEEFFINMNLVLIPGPYLRNHGTMRPSELMDSVCSFDYWDPHEFSHLCEKGLAYNEERFNEVWGEFA